MPNLQSRTSAYPCHPCAPNCASLLLGAPASIACSRPNGFTVDGVYLKMEGVKPKERLEQLSARIDRDQIVLHLKVGSE